MAVTIPLLMAVLAVLFQQTHDPQADMAAAQRMRQREASLRQEMSRPWQEVEALEKAFLHSVFYWLCQAAAAVVLIEVSLQKQLGSSSCPERDDDSSEEGDSEEDEDLNGSHSDARSLAWPTLFPAQELPDLSRTLKQMLCDVQGLSQSTFMPKISPHTAMNGTRESRRVHKN